MAANLPDDPLEPDAPAEEARGSLADGVKKALLAGMGALFLTEESARRLARDWKLPKELIGFVGQQAQGAKDELLRVFAAEIRRFLESEAVRKEFWQGLTENTVELEVRIRFRPDGAGAPRPEVETAARSRKPRRARK
ncbi:MAG TPA: hypothetical protein VFL83_16555 [Anaeromyxobacter sp.]|nr:hypothetical protein [Anaeromyxobacter sp.]